MKKFINLLFGLFSLFSVYSQIHIDSSFENANAKIYHINNEKNEIIFTPALKKNQTTKCWFYFKIWGFQKNIPLNIKEINSDKKLVPSYPVYSTDNIHWKKVKANPISDNITEFKIPTQKADTIYFAAGYPYSYTQLITYINSIANNIFLDTTTLTTSEKGLNIPLLVITDTNIKDEKDLVWIIARQHAFESPANYCIEGIINFLISDHPLADSFRKSTIAYIVPMVDVDNVFYGKSGRMQKPIDFNRDWQDNPKWKALKEITNLIQTTAEVYDFRIFMDIHATFPGTSSPIFAYFNLFQPNTPQYENLHQFWMTFSLFSDIIPQEVIDYSQEKYADKYIATKYPYIDFATTIECDWNLTDNDKQWTPQLWRQTGENIGKAIAEYLIKTNAK